MTDVTPPGPAFDEALVRIGAALVARAPRPLQIAGFRPAAVLVPILDRPGVVSEVTAAVSRAGCNIESIEIDHQSEDTAVLVLVLTDEGNMAAVVTDLEDRGYRPRLQPLDAAQGEES